MADIEWRGIGQAMNTSVQGFSGGANTSITHRTRHYSKSKFNRVRAVIQTFYPTGTPIADTDFITDYKFQIGLEAVYKHSLTGINPRVLFTFSAANFVQYLAASPPSSGYIVSDILELDSYIEADQFFGLWTTVQVAAGSNLIPYQRNSSSFIPGRFVGSVSGSDNIAADTARLSTSCSAPTSAQSGASTYFTPAFLLIETDTNVPFVVVIGDSINYGVGEGVAGSGSLGDTLGSALGNCGIVERSLSEFSGYNYVNFSRGSDGNKFLKTSSNWTKRQNLLSLANPTHVINANCHNDITPTIAIGNWAASTTYSRGDAKQANGNHYVCTRGGISGTVAPSGTTGRIIDGACLWMYLSAQGASTPTEVSLGRGSSEIVGQIMLTNDIISEILPGVPIIGMTVTPDASSTDAWATEGNQTTATGWGGPLSRRGRLNKYIRDLHPALGISGFFDPSQVLEASPGTETSKWAINGSASYVTNDGTHPNSVGYALFAPTGIPLSLIGGPDDLPVITFVIDFNKNNKISIGNIVSGNTYKMRLLAKKNGVNWDLTGAKVKIGFKLPDGSVSIKSAGISDAPSGAAEYNLLAEDVGPSGLWALSWEVMQGSVAQESVPTSFIVVAGII